MSSREPARPWMLVLAYVPLLWLVPLYSGKRRDVRWHARNGLLLFAAVAAFAMLAALIVSVLAVDKALQGQRLVVPGLSRYADR